MADRTKRAFKDQAYAEVEQIGKAVASRRRIELLDLLSQGPHSVEELAGEAGTSVANASQHLQRLKQARLVRTTRRGNHIDYELAGPRVAAFLSSLLELAEVRLPQVESLKAGFFDDEPLGLEDLDEVLGGVERDEIVLLDVRPEREYRAGHLPGARCLPPETISTAVEEMPEDRSIVAYCRGPYCTFAADAVERLREAGRDARRLELGVADFIRHGVQLQK